MNAAALHWLRPTDPPDAFPPAGAALREPNGLLAAGGDLSPARLLAAYRRGIFPWFSAGDPILWWSPDPRAILLPQELHLSRSLRRRLRSNQYTVSVDQAFGDLIRLCAQTRGDSGTWLTPAMIDAYVALHALGHAHSVEVWADGELAGGLYGIGMGAVFFGESMVSLRADASKVALARLVAIAQERDIALIDCQVPNDHLASLGSRPMPRGVFLGLLAELIDGDPAARLRPEPPQPTSTSTQVEKMAAEQG